MPKLFVTDLEGNETEIEAEAGLSVMEIVHPRFPDDLLALCGGACSCATCHVYVEEGFLDKLPPQGDIEKELLEMSECQQGNSRLSCQIPFGDALDGLKVTIAPEA